MYNCPNEPEPGYIPEPYHIPGYTGHIPTMRYRFGTTYGRTSRKVLEDPCVAQAPIPVLQSPYRPTCKEDQDNFQPRNGQNNSMYDNDLTCEFCPQPPQQQPQRSNNKSCRTSDREQRPQTSCGFPSSSCSGNGGNNNKSQWCPQPQQRSSQERPKTAYNFPPPSFDNQGPQFELEFECPYCPQNCCPPPPPPPVQAQARRPENCRDRERKRPKTAGCPPPSCRQQQQGSRGGNENRNNCSAPPQMQIDESDDYTSLFPECMIRPQTAGPNFCCPSSSSSRPQRGPIPNPNPNPSEFDCNRNGTNIRQRESEEADCWVNSAPVGCTDLGCCSQNLCRQKPKPKKKNIECDPLPCCQETCNPIAHHINRSPYACPCRDDPSTDIYRCCESLPSTYAGHVPGFTFHSNGRTFGKSTFATKKYMEKCMFYNTFAK